MRKRIVLASVLICLLAVAAHYRYDPWGFYWKVSEEEASLRSRVVAEAEQFLGCAEKDGSHKAIIDQYNAHEPLAMGYTVQYTDSWCATFVSTVAIRCGLTEIIPTECGCERQIGLLQALGCWDEADDGIPLPGDLIYYDWDQNRQGNNTGWSDHVGIVVGIKWPFVRVIEGNKDDQVSYRVILLGDKTIRGYGRPDYHALLESAA